MIINDLNPKQLLRITRTMFFALIAGLLLFLAVVLYINDTDFIFRIDLSDELIIAAFILSLIFLPASYLYTKMSFNKIDQNELLKNKIHQYQSGQIIRLATCEGVGMYSIVSLVLTSNPFFLIFLMITLLIMALYYPTPDKIGQEINLTVSEIDKFNE